MGLRWPGSSRFGSGAAANSGAWLRICEDFGSKVPAAAAAGGYTQALLQFRKTAHVIRRRFADLSIGDSVADTNVHGAWRDLGTSVYLNANENHCQ